MIRIFAILMMLASPTVAVEPDEILDDPALEQRARDISSGLRCTVCQNESIDESSAPVARDLRLLVRERLVAGESDEEVLAYVVDRFGEYVLLRPDARGANLLLWLAAPVLFAVALFVGWRVIRRRPAQAKDSLSDEEKARLEELLRQ